MKHFSSLLRIVCSTCLLLGMMFISPVQTAQARPAPVGLGANAPDVRGSLQPAAPNSVDAHTTDGVTIIMHGWNPSMAGTPAWLASMRSAIAANFLGNEQNFGAITVTRSGLNLVATCSPWNVDLTSKTTGGVLIILDWSAVADHLTGGPPIQDVAAVVVDKIVTGQNGQKPLAELPIHLIGHSRGGALSAELAHQLGERGVVVDQLTLLDPHPLTASDPQPFGSPVIDTPLAVYQNVVFADNYWQNAEVPTGEGVGNAYNRQWETMPGGYYNLSSPIYPNHRNIYLMYQGTVDLGNPVNNGEASMGATERAAWFNAYETSGDDSGFTYSRLDGGGDRTSAAIPVAGGDAIRDGLNNDPVFGGGGGRSSLSWSLAAWPNVARLDVLSGGLPMGPGVHSITIGAALQLQYVYLDYDSGGTVTLYADADHNPYNGNNLATLSTQPFASATGGTYTLNTVDWDTGSMSDGTTTYVYAKITDGARTRYLYATPTLQFRSDNFAPTDITVSASSAAENQPAGTTVGALTTTDPDAGDTHTYSFGCTVPGADDASFGIVGSSLNTAAVFDYETKNSYAICIRSTDSGALHFDKNFTVTIADAPNVELITRAGANASQAASVDFHVTFSEPVSNLHENDFQATGTGTLSGVEVTGISGGPTDFTVAMSTGTGTGTLRLDIPTSAGILDADGNSLEGLPYTGGETYSVRPQTFTDVPMSYWSWNFIERLYLAGITGGCSTAPLMYCPEATVTRAQMAVFLLVAEHGSGYTPPAASGIFNDVPANNGFAPWIEQLYNEGITGGCGNGNYCPNAPVTRAQMAVFLLVAEHGTGYTPPAASGLFTDVPVSSGFAPWIEQLANEGITGGCGGGNYCPNNPVPRAQMAVFLVAAFNLP